MITEIEPPLCLEMTGVDLKAGPEGGSEGRYGGNDLKCYFSKTDTDRQAEEFFRCLGTVEGLLFDEIRIPPH